MGYMERTHWLTHIGTCSPPSKEKPLRSLGSELNTNKTQEKPLKMLAQQCTEISRIAKAFIVKADSQEDFFGQTQAHVCKSTLYRVSGVGLLGLWDLGLNTIRT